MSIDTNKIPIDELGNYIGYTFDLECDELYLACTKIWYGHFRSLDGSRSLSIHPFQLEQEESHRLIMEWANSFPDGALVVTFNGLSYDQFVLWKLLGINFSVGKAGFDWIEDKKVQFLDAFYLAQFLDPNLPSFSLDSLTKGSTDEKIDYRAALVDAGAMTGQEAKGFEFTFYHPLMVEYCTGDVLATASLAKKQIKEMKTLYGTEWLTPAFKLGQKSHFLMKAQEHSGSGFDLPYALEVQQQLIKDMEELERSVLPQLPERPLKKGEEHEYSLPAKPWLKDGSYSSHMLNFIAKHSGKIVGTNQIEFYGKVYTVQSKLMLDVKMPMVIGDQQHFKQWLLEEQGWQPTFWNFQKDAKGKPVKDEKNQLTLTSPKLQEAGVICPNLLSLEGELVKEVVKFLSLRNRLSVITSWINNPRLAFDNRIGASATKIANSHRQCHSVICNVPRAGGASLYGDEFRKLFCAQDGNVIVGADSSGLEQRCAGHMTFKYDSGEYARELLDGDVHSKVACSMFAEETAGFDYKSSTFNKEDPKFKPYRNKAKSAGYAILYGCSPAKLAKMMGKPEAIGKKMHKAYWDANPAMAKFIENLTKWWETRGNKTHVPAVDGRLLKTRSKHSLANNILQSLGAILMDTACCFMDSYLGEMFIDDKGRPYYLYKGHKVIRTIYYHDEYSFECHKDVAQDVLELMEKAMIKAGEFHKLTIPLKGEGKIGMNWQEIH